jgi:hypothetical protein
LTFCMDPALSRTVHVRGHVGGTRSPVSRIFVISAIFIGVLSTAWIIGNALLAPRKPVPVDKIRATVQLAPDQLGRCEHFEWDNETGLMSPRGATECAHIRKSLGRQLDGIKHHFESR